MKKKIPIYITLSVIVLAVFYFSGNKKKVSFNLSDERMRGNAKAKVVVIEYADIQCPACSFMQRNWDKVWRIVENDVLLIFRHFPLSTHTHAHEAAVYTEAANLQGKFWEMHDLLMERQSEWSVLGTVAVKETFIQYAREINLDINQFSKDLEEKRDVFLKKIKDDTESGKNVGVQGTPTLFVNNTKIDIPRDPKELLSILKNYINQ